MYGNVHAAEVVLLEHDVAHLLAVLERVHGRFGEEDLAAGGVDLHLLVEGEVPEVFHVIPSLDDPVLHLKRGGRGGISMGVPRMHL